ncbi:hypothetical protein NADFUDRAFT_45381 [Nadsonia fulvescens var. elongata DSM 6958]|uniref:Uncharacterized protein n=1 Tax=Nadsonia fulvescens var. elongata DSM 6958 TaxID=857566 RepID=A0A1E3PP46_9ASCO|nr:hypothetical protein NADFUDRAFT_45381 [Nadsonia fulvescens var. elongata DSM 6958]
MLRLGRLGPGNSIEIIQQIFNAPNKNLISSISRPLVVSLCTVQLLTPVCCFS